jgi:lactoylglutathione lyase
MIKIEGIYEIAIRVHDLAKSEAFYRQVLGLEVGLRDRERPWVFLRVGRKGMVVLQEDKGDWPLQHFAFTVKEAELDASMRYLVQQGVAVEGPVFHEWIPAKSLYFRDPDGHDLEICVPV